MFRIAAFTLVTLIILLNGCKKELEGESYDPEGSTNTVSKGIDFQVRKIWREGDVSVSNEFTGARLNNFERVSDSLFRATVNPENEPVNKSPWYAFQVQAANPRSVAIELHYPNDYRHRYYPDLSTDLTNWSPIDSVNFIQDTVANVTTLLLEIGPEPLYISAQEVLTSNDVYAMQARLDSMDFISSDIAGYSHLGRAIPVLKIGNETSDNVVVILGRQHPPETTGYLAMRSFMEEIISDDPVARAFREDHLTILFPMLNPDGIDQGHWRHNAGGVDLNRDWQYFNQPETAAVKNYIEKMMAEGQRKILFEIDFHSTQEDLFYVFKPDQPSNLTGFTHDWLDDIESRLPWYVADRVPTSGNSPVSTYWFHTTYNTEAVTYEVGDNSPRATINEIGITAAKSMMQLLQSRK